MSEPALYRPTFLRTPLFELLQIGDQIAPRWPLVAKAGC